MPTFDPYGQHLGFPAAMSYQPQGLPGTMPYPQPTYQSLPRPRPQVIAPKPQRPAPTAQPEPVAARQVEVPPPEQLGIRLDDRVLPVVVVPDPEKLGIRLD
jgi:hypothetical protein